MSQNPIRASSSHGDANPGLDVGRIGQDHTCSQAPFPSWLCVLLSLCCLTDDVDPLGISRPATADLPSTSCISQRGRARLHPPPPPLHHGRRARPPLPAPQGVESRKGEAAKALLSWPAALWGAAASLALLPLAALAVPLLAPLAPAPGLALGLGAWLCAPATLSRGITLTEARPPSPAAPSLPPPQ